MEHIQENSEKNSLTNSLNDNWWDSLNNSISNTDSNDLVDKIAHLYTDGYSTSTISRQNSDKVNDLYPIYNKKPILPNFTSLKKGSNVYEVYQQSVQKWKCVVTNISNKTFRAKLEDLNEEINTTYEIAEFDFEEVSPSDMPLLNLGAVFYWSVGYEMKNGQLTKRSSIRFQRLVTWSASEYDIALEKAEHFLNNIAWD